MASCAYYLFINWHGEVGAKVSSAAFVGASLGQILVIIGNICVIANIISFSLFISWRLSLCFARYFAAVSGT